MMLHFNVTGKQRKQMVGVISEYLGVPSKYLFLPTCAFEIGEYTVTKEGALEWPDEEHIEKTNGLVQAIIAAGFDEPDEWREAAEADTTEETETNGEETAQEGETELGLTVEIPRAYFTDSQIENLQKLVEAKAGLLKQALAIEELPITITDEKVSFPWFTTKPDADECGAYTCLITSICRMAKEAKRVTAKDKEVDNPKYAFRCFLLRLGFIGEEYKQSRKILLKNLTGSSAFKSVKKEEAEA